MQQGAAQRIKKEKPFLYVNCVGKDSNYSTHENYKDMF